MSDEREAEWQPAVLTLPDRWHPIIVEDAGQEGVEMSNRVGRAKIRVRSLNETDICGCTMVLVHPDDAPIMFRPEFHSKNAPMGLAMCQISTD